MSQFSDYEAYVTAEAENFMEENKEEVVEEIVKGIQDTYRLLMDVRVVEWVDNDFVYVDLEDASVILERSRTELPDDSLWAEKTTESALKTKAYFTYKEDLTEEVLKQLKRAIEEEIQNVKIQIEDFAQDMSEVPEESNEYGELEKGLETMEEHFGLLVQARDEL